MLSNYKNALRRIEETNPNFDFPAWTFQQVKKPERDVPNYAFYDKEIDLGIIDIPAEKIVGTDHDSYNKTDENWLLMLSDLERYRKTPNENIEKFAIGEFGSPAHYAKYGEEYYIFGDGNHRTCLAKFSNVKSIRARVTEHIFNSNRFECNTRLNELGIFVRQDKPFWILQLNNEKFVTVTNDLIDPFIKYLQEYRINKMSLIWCKIKKYFTKEEPSYRIENMEQIKDLDIEIILHQQKIRKSQNLI